MTNNAITVPAFKVEQPIGEFLVASMDAEVLADISYADVRRMGEKDGKREIERYLGIQRPLKENRRKQIRRYILEDPTATFPTSVILAVDEKCVEYDEEKCLLRIHAYEATDPEEESIPYNKIAKVLDGQHRIAGFYDGDGENRTFSMGKAFQVNVSIFVGIDLPEQAEIFARVNLAQTKVSKSIVYDLEELARKRNPFKTCHHVAVALDANSDSPFYERIKRLGVATPGRNYEPLTQQSFVEALVRFISDDPARDRNDILDGRKLKHLDSEKHPFRKLFLEGEDGDIDIYKIVYNYFSAVKRKWPQSWDEKKRSGNLLPKSNAFKALMKYLKDDVYLGLVKEEIGRVPTISEFQTAFEHVTLTDDDFTTKNFVPGSGGQSAFYKVLTGHETIDTLYEQ